ncbi:MAG: DUF4199 domain-containing protein [Ginsengibacter sp.]
MEQAVTTTTTKGIVIGLILVVMGIALYFTNMDTSGPARWLVILIFVIGIIWAVNNYGKQIDHNATFGNYFAHGFKVTAVVTVIMIIYIAVFINLFPEFKERAMEQARVEMEKGGKMSSDQISQTITLTKKFFMVFAIGGTLLTYIIFGALAAVIGAAITKKEPNAFHGDLNQTLQ